MIAVGRYVAASCLGSQRWVAAGLLFVVGVAVTFATGGRAPSTLAEGATWLFPITAWLTVATLNDEDPSQAAITAAAVGVGRARATKLGVAGAAGVAMGAVSVLAGFVASSGGFTAEVLAAGVVAHVLAVAGGVAVGSLCARPLLVRPGWSVLAVLGITVVDLVVPHAPPARAVLAALDGTGTTHLWRSLAIGAGEVAVFAVVLIAISTQLSRSRS